MTEQQKQPSTRICSRRETREAEGYTLVYTLWEIRGTGKTGTVFSVTVTLNKGAYSDEKTAFDITRNRHSAEQIFNLVVRNTVTPCTLIDVLEDIL